jgi:hypothetical protein
MTIDLSEIELKVLNGFLSFADANNETSVTEREVADSIDLPKYTVHYNIDKLISKKLIKVIRILDNKGSLKCIYPNNINLKCIYPDSNKKKEGKKKGSPEMRYSRESLGLWQSNYDQATSRLSEKVDCDNYQDCLTICAIYDGNYLPCPKCNGKPPWDSKWMSKILAQFEEDAKPID